MDCNYTEKISALIDGELSAAETRELESHMLICGDCHEAKVDFLSLRSQINDYPVAFKPVAQREALARILGKNKGIGSGAGWRWVFNPAVAGVAALLIIAVVVALLLYPKSKPGPVTHEEVAERTGKKPTPTPSVQREGAQKDRNTPPAKNATPNDKNKLPNKKRPPVIVEPAESNITETTLALNNSTSLEPEATRVRSADTETMTAIHFQKSELLLRSFRNVRTSKPNASAELSYEKRLAQQLVYQNMMLRREADASGDAQVASLLESLEPILLDIANLPAKPANNEVRVIKDRVERKNIVALLQVNSTALARALD